MRHAPAGETHETGFHVGQRLRQVCPQSVTAPPEGLLREEGDHVQVNPAPQLRFNEQPCVGDSLVCHQHRFQFPPAAARFLCLRLSDDVALFICQADDETALAGVRCTGKNGEVVFLTCCHRYAVEAFIDERDAFFIDLQYSIVPVVGMNGCHGVNDE